MKFIFVSNFLNHHQIPFCNELKHLCEEFYFIATENGSSQGYQVSQEAEYLIDYKANKRRAEELILSSDVVIFGSCPNHLIDIRMQQNKLSFLYSERFFKKGTWRRFIPRTRKSVKERIVKYKDKNIFVLCASAFLSYDLSLLGFPAEKCFKWGYFPECGIANKQEKTNKKSNTILWAGRMLDWKQPETAVEIAKKLKHDGIYFTLNIVGEGPQNENLQRLIAKYNLQDRVFLLGSKNYEELMKIMQQHQIFLFTSNSREGWGAVLNEAMANGCAVVANSAIGAVPFLIENNKNGIIYRNGKISEAYVSIKELLAKQKKSLQMGKAAQKTMFENYNYKVAAERIFDVSSQFLKHGKINSFEQGIMSYAPILKKYKKKEK